MATRLEIQHGLISERDRLSTSADTVSVTRPSTGSKTRSKGVLFIVVGSAIPGPRAREATKLVAETIRHEYYYDESAGVPVCLEKAIKAADRRLRSSREGAGLPPGSLGVAAAVWGFAFVAQRVGMRYVEPFTFNAVRFTRTCTRTPMARCTMPSSR